LIGMVVVAISINVARILDTPYLPGRAGGALVPLACALVISILALVPAQPIAAFGAETLLAGIITWGMTGFLMYRLSKASATAPRWRFWSHLALNYAQGGPLLVACVLLTLGRAEGLYWLVPGMVFAFLGGILNTWVLLVEILR
jgi:modulator of FtsH protease